MFELLGIVFGGVSRLTQHYMEMQDKEKERVHEREMFDKQVTLQTQKIEAEKDLRTMDIAAQKDASELDALMTAIQSQAKEATAAGGWVLSLSASVRPVVSYWLLFIYSAAKCATLYLALSADGAGLAEAVRASYTEFDGAMLGSIISFWFADRSLRKAHQ
jgi:hypothetical protein